MKLTHVMQIGWLKDDAQYAILLEFLEKHRDCIDELSLCNDFCHTGYRPLQEQAPIFAVLRKRAMDLKSRGWTVGLDILGNIGHIDEGYTCFGEVPYTPITSYDGTKSKCCMCPEDPMFQQYIEEKYRMALDGPWDFYWVNDDIKLFFNGVRFGCFCENCIRRFNTRMGTDYTRETLVAVMEQPEEVALRAAWVQDISDRMTDFLRLLGNVIRSAHPEIPIGFMPQHQSWSTYNGCDYATWFQALGASRGRPGEGFYFDTIPTDLYAKALATGRQAEEFPGSVTDVQYELEDFPYMRFQKSIRVNLAECTLAAAQGMNGILLRTLKSEEGASLADHDPLYDAISGQRSIWDRMETFGNGMKTRGFYPALSSKYDQRRPLHNGESFFRFHNETRLENVIPTYALGHIGVPMTLDYHNADGIILHGNLSDGYTDEEIIEFLHGALILDAEALAALERRGFGRYTGVRTSNWFSDAVRERYNMDDDINEGIFDWYREVRIAFWNDKASALEALDSSVRVISNLENYRYETLGIAGSLYENELGGRVCVLTYSPFEKIYSISRFLQMQRICEFLTKDTLPAKIIDPCKAAQFIRTDEKGRALYTFINLSLDCTKEIRVAIRGASTARLLLEKGSECILPVQKTANMVSLRFRRQRRLKQEFC